MSSWVRYSVAVYAGLLLAGALIVPQPQASVGSAPQAAENHVHDATCRHAERPSAAPSDAGVTDGQGKP
jgi:hypothetical protein